MRKNLLVLLLLICLASCTSLIPATDLPSTSAEIGDSLEATAAETLTPAPQPTATGTDIPLTPTPSLTATFTPYPTPPGLLTHEELEQRMQDWISGDIEFTDEDRKLDEYTGEGLRLGVLNTGPLGSVTFLFYNLGFGVINDQDNRSYLITVVGFEDGNGHRFTSVFHSGRLRDSQAIIRLLEFKGRRENREERVSFEELSPEEFAKRTVDLPMSVIASQTFTDGVTGRDAWNNYLGVGKDAMTLLMNFLMSENCSIDNVPTDLKPLINTIPEEYNSDIPYLYEYKVSYW